MEKQSEILRQVDEYIEKYPEEKLRIEPFKKFVSSFDGDDLIDRQNFVGHLTASAFILNLEMNALLLLKHKALERWLQPGGHIDATDVSIIEAAFREAVEETGIERTNLALLDIAIFDIDSHSIPANEKKKEPAHVHHDIRFLLKCKVSNEVLFDETESTAAQWVSFSELRNNVDFKNVVVKVMKEIKCKISI